MNTAQLTPRALAVIADSGETGEPIFRTPCSVGSGGGEVDRCPCGYPMPCSINVPTTMCRAHPKSRASLVMAAIAAATEGGA